MNRYDKNRRCQKCGGVATTTHVTEPYTGASRMQRSCLRCSYTWSESPLDVPAIPDVPHTGAQQSAGG